MVDVKKPFIVKNLLSQDDLKGLQKLAMRLWSTKPAFEKNFGRHQWHDDPELKAFHNKLLDSAKEHFGSQTLMPSWCLLSAYETENAKLWSHKDDNACTYHIDLCVFQKVPWSLWVEHDGVKQPYMLMENDALFMYGNDQEHWREKFPHPENNLVVNAFFFFCEPDHWYFTEGPGYLYTDIRKEKPKGGM